MRAPRWLVSHRYVPWPCKECGKRRMRYQRTEHDEKIADAYTERTKTERTVNDDGSITTTERRERVARPERFEISRFVHECECCGWVSYGEWSGVLLGGYSTWSESQGYRQR